MNPKSTVILEKALQDRHRGDFKKALQRLEDGIRKVPDDVALYKEAIDIALEAGESTRAIQLFKKACSRLPRNEDELWTYAIERIHAFNDPMLCKALLDLAVRKRAFPIAENVLEALKDHTASELLQRTRTKQKTLSSAVGGGLSLKGEIITNLLAEAMLCARANRHTETVSTFLQVLADKPVEHETLTPYLTTLEKKLKQNGGITFLLGTSLVLSEQYPKGLAKIVQGVSLDASYADQAVTRLQSLRDVPDIPSEEIDLALARVALARGDEHQATVAIESILAKNAAKAPAVIELLEPHVQEIEESLVLNYLYIEASLLANRPERALTHLKTIYRDRRRRSDLLAWMDVQSQERFLPVEIIHYYGEIALDQQMYEKAIEIFREVIAQAPQEAGSVKVMLERYASQAAVRGYLTELGRQDPTAPAKKGSGLDIEHYGAAGFGIDLGGETPSQAKPTPPSAAGANTPGPREATAARHDETNAPVGPKQPETPATVPGDHAGGTLAAADPQRPDATAKDNAGTAVESDRQGIRDANAGAPSSDLDAYFQREKKLSLSADDTPPPFEGFERAKEIRIGGPKPSGAPLDSAIEKNRSPFSSRTPVEPPAWLEEKPTEGDLNADIDELLDPPAADAAPVTRSTPPAVADDPTSYAAPPPADEPPTRDVEDDSTSYAEPPPSDETPTRDVADDSIIYAEPPPSEETPTGDAADDSTSYAEPPPSDEPPTGGAADDSIIYAGPPPSDETPTRDTVIDSTTHTEPPASDQGPASVPPQDDFNSRFRMFKGGTLPKPVILELVEEASRTGRRDEMKALLEFTPDNVAQEIKRKFHLADYYISGDRPLNALIILKTVHMNGLGRDEKRAFLVKIAYCYRMLNQYDAAHSAYLRVLSEDPDFAVAERMAKHNYEKYLDEAAGAAPVLEKITNL